jgi:hypothetical protein
MARRRGKGKVSAPIAARLVTEVERDVGLQRFNQASRNPLGTTHGRRQAVEELPPGQ